MLIINFLNNSGEYFALFFESIENTLYYEKRHLKS